MQQFYGISKQHEFNADGSSFTVKYANGSENEGCSITKLVLNASEL